MVDANRQFRPPEAPAAPFEVVGVNGIGDIPTPRLPSVPDIQVEDTTAQNIARQQQSIDRAFNYASSSIQQTMEAETRLAETTSRNASRNRAAGLVGALAQGYEIYKDLQTNRREQELAALEVSQNEMAAAYEAEVRNVVQELREHFVNEGMEFGSISAYQESLNRLRREFEGRVDPEVLRTVNAIGFDALAEVTQTFGERRATQVAEIRDSTRANAESAIGTQLDIYLEQIANAPIGADLEQTYAVVHDTIRDGLDAMGLHGVDRARVSAALLDRSAAQLAKLGGDLSRINQQRNILNDVLGQADQVWQETAGDERLLRLRLQPLQAELERAGLGFVNLVELNPSQIEQLERDMAFRQRANELNPAANGGVTPRNETERLAYSVTLNAEALNWVNNPAQYSSAIARAQGPDATPAEKELYTVYQQIQDDVDRVQTFDAEINALETQVAEAQLEAEQILDRIDPDNRIGRPQTFGGWGNVLTNAQGVAQNPELSQQAAEAAQRVQQLAASGAVEQIEALTRRRDNLLESYLRGGVNLRDTRDTSRVNQLLEEYQPVYEQMAGRAQAQAQMRGSPSNFTWGLEPLRPLQPRSQEATGLPQLPMGSP